MLIVASLLSAMLLLVSVDAGKPQTCLPLPKYLDIKIMVHWKNQCDGYTNLTQRIIDDAEYLFPEVEAEFDSRTCGRTWIDPEGRMRFLRDVAGKDALQEDRELITICKRCWDATNWRRCVKNRCSGSGRRRILVSYGDDRQLGKPEKVDGVEEPTQGETSQEQERGRFEAQKKLQTVITDLCSESKRNCECPMYAEVEDITREVIDNNP